jgi:hypothetical protein
MGGIAAGQYVNLITKYYVSAILDPARIAADNRAVYSGIW